MRVKLYDLLSDKIEEGLGWGIRRVYKYSDGPKTEDDLLGQTDEIMREIMEAVCQYLDFEDDAEG